MKQGGFWVRAWIALLAGALGCSFPAPALAAPNETKLVSRADNGDKQNGSFVDTPAISADGRYVAFSTNADNLEGGSGFERVYLRDTENDTIELVSRADGATLVNPNGGSRNPSVSADGRFVAFESDATNLVSFANPFFNDTNGVTDVYVRDTQTNSTVGASRATLGNLGDGASSDPSISADGSYVAFESEATDLSGGGAGTKDIFVRGLQGTELNTTFLISRNTAGDPGDGNSVNPSISGDGLRVAFDSKAIDLDPADSDIQDDIFLRERQFGSHSGTTTLVSRADTATGDSGDGQSIEPSISSDGQHVAFASGATNLVDEDISGIRQIFKRNLQTDDTSLVSRADGAGNAGDGLSSKPSVSADGRFVAFESGSTNLDGGGPALTDIFLRDTQANDSILLSRANGAGAAANASSLRPSISGDGLVTAFYTDATNLDAADSDVGVTDVYTREADVDIVAPTTTINSAPSARTGDNTPTVGYTSAAGDLAGFECSIDGAPFAACAGSSITTPELADGAHNVRVRAFDTAANRGAPVTAAFTVDTVGPATQITSAPPATVTSTATVGFSSPAADAVAFQCSIDGAAFAACASPFTTPALADGSHTVDVRALDDLGNVGAAQRVAFSVDTPEADPDPPPSDEPDNDFSFGKAKRNAKKGSAKLSVEVPGAGELELSGKGVKPVSEDVSGESTVDLPVKAKGKLKKKLKKKRKVTANVEVTFTPDGGDPNTQDASVKLKLKKK